MDLLKYLQFKNMVDADVAEAQTEMLAAKARREQADADYDEAATRLKHFQAVQMLFASIQPPPPPPVSITTTVLPDGVVDTAYSASLIGAGGTSPYTWTAVGQLPSGITLATDGTISGTPASAGVFAWTAIITDSKGKTNSAVLSITIR